MKVLVIGGGGREHALVWKLAQSPHVTRMWCAPGNGGIEDERLASNGSLVTNVPLSADDIPALVAFGCEHKPDLTVVGPDNPLALGVVDAFQRAGLRIWGPNQKASQFESSKAFSQEFMERHGIPTARAGTFTDPVQAIAFAASFNGKCAVKADGLALGKGVLLTQSIAEATDAIHSILIDKSFGDAGKQIVIQEYLEGTEISLHALVDGVTARLFPTSQDHKRAFDGDAGPNTGGMGTYCPTPFISEQELSNLTDTLLKPWITGCQADGIDFCGLLYPGIMLTADGPKVLEFNARFGDPETQVYLCRLRNDLFELLSACVDKSLGKIQLEWEPGASVCVVLAAPGYPGSYPKGEIIHGLETVAGMANTKVFHAGTRQASGHHLTNGGRVLGVTSWADTLQNARDKAYAAAQQIHFPGVQYRQDIAAKGLNSLPLNAPR